MEVSCTANSIQLSIITDHVNVWYSVMDGTMDHDVNLHIVTINNINPQVIIVLIHPNTKIIYGQNILDSSVTITYQLIIRVY